MKSKTRSSKPITDFELNDTPKNSSKLKPLRPEDEDDNSSYKTSKATSNGVEETNITDLFLNTTPKNVPKTEPKSTSAGSSTTNPSGSQPSSMKKGQSSASNSIKTLYGEHEEPPKALPPLDPKSLEARDRVFDVITAKFDRRLLEKLNLGMLPLYETLRKNALDIATTLPANPGS